MSTEEKSTPMTSEACPGVKTPDTEVSTNSNDNISNLLSQLMEHAVRLSDVDHWEHSFHFFYLGDVMHVIFRYKDKSVELIPCDREFTEEDLKRTIALCEILEELL